MPTGTLVESIASLTFSSSFRTALSLPLLIHDEEMRVSNDEEMRVSKRIKTEDSADLSVVTNVPGTSSIPMSDSTPSSSLGQMRVDQTYDNTDDFELIRKFLSYFLATCYHALFPSRVDYVTSFSSCEHLVFSSRRRLGGPGRRPTSCLAVAPGTA